MHGENLKLILKYYLVVNECYSKVCVCDITISCASSVFMWLYIQSLVAVACVLVWHVIHTCALGGCNKNNILMRGTYIKNVTIMCMSRDQCVSRRVTTT